MTTSNHGVTDRSDAARLLRSAAGIFGAVFLVVGVLGFVPGITTHYGDLALAGHQSGAKLLGIFEVSVLHNIVHLAFGVAGLLASRRTADAAAAYLLFGGVIYAVVWIYGVLVGEESAANFVPLNTADNWLHFFLALAMIALGFAGRRRLHTGSRTATV